MKKLIIIPILLTNCSAAQYDFPIEFNNRVNQGLFQMNVRDCRSQPQCSADELFDRW